MAGYRLQTGNFLPTPPVPPPRLLRHAQNNPGFSCQKVLPWTSVVAYRCYESLPSEDVLLWSLASRTRCSVNFAFLVHYFASLVFQDHMSVSLALPWCCPWSPASQAQYSWSYAFQALAFLSLLWPESHSLNPVLPAMSSTVDLPAQTAPDHLHQRGSSPRCLRIEIRKDMWFNLICQKRT